MPVFEFTMCYASFHKNNIHVSLVVITSRRLKIFLPKNSKTIHKQIKKSKKTYPNQFNKFLTVKQKASGRPFILHKAKQNWVTTIKVKNKTKNKKGAQLLAVMEIVQVMIQNRSKMCLPQQSLGTNHEVYWLQHQYHLS